MQALQYPHVVTLQVAFRDLDAMGHVNNAVYLSYLETARIEFMMDLLAFPNLMELPVILGEVTIRYLSPALFGERLHIGSGISRLGTKSFDLVHQIDTGDGRFIASAKTTLIMYDYARQTTQPIADTFRQQVTNYQGDWIAPF